MVSIVDVKEIIEAGVHFGHRASRWHPKMAPYIFGKRNLIHIIDVRQTVKGLVRASNFLIQCVASGQDVVFVGTKRQAKSLIMREAQRCGMHWVSERWLGGTLTNYHTIRLRLKRLEELEALEASGRIEEYSKKRISALRRERRKILRNLEGIRGLKQLPGCLVVVDIRREYIALREARKVGIPVVALVDTDCDPTDVDIVVPGNDDAYRSIQVILKVFADSVLLGRRKHEVYQAEQQRARQVEEPPRREPRSSAGAAEASRAGGGPAERPAPTPPAGAVAPPADAPAPAAEAEPPSVEAAKSEG
ncbi:MAG: 30S ribosomal protein S2 [Planctomycetes bacterium]|nr:30S ribosomal protein S2 [Planctomycetota bacterium]